MPYEILHVIDIRKNLLHKSLFGNYSFKLVFVLNMFVQPKNDIFVAKEYLSNGLFKISVLNVMSRATSKSMNFVYLLEPSNIWHARLEHDNFDSLCIN